MKMRVRYATRHTAVSLLVALCAIACASAMGAEWKPEHNVEIIVGTGPAGGQDKTARTLQRILQEHKLVGAPVIVVNKPGGGGAVGWTYLSQHAGDAHHVEIGNPTLLTNHIIGRSPIGYTDFTPIAILFTESVAFSVRADSPIQSGRDLVERLRKDPSSVSFSVGSSLGSANHIAMGEVTRLAGGDPRRLKAVVFQGGGEAMTALLGGHVDLVASAANNVVNQVAAGKLRVIGVTAPQRLSGALAVVPTWREQGIDVTVNNWRMVAGPKGLTHEQLAFWEAVVRRATDSAEWKQDLERNAFENMFMTGQEAQRFLKSQYEVLQAALAQIGMAKP
jgi:putative tricarboxylic transport membrane protein